METWKTINVNPIYEISSFGNIRFKFISKKVPIFNVLGYKRSNIGIGKNRKSVSIRRMVAIAFIPNPENKPQVNHINGIKTDNRVENLEWCTASENIIHSFRVLNKQINKGEKCNLSKLKENDIIFIRENKNKFTVKEYCEMFNISQSAICNILNYKRWAHIK